LLQSEILGHARGAFTDAKEERKGLLELAHGGTLFLDEIEAASYALQSLLVGQVEQPEVRRIGDARGRPVDVRFISASNADLGALVSASRFRADLLDRLSYLVIEVPTLAECPEAIIPLAEKFVREHLSLLNRDFAFKLSLGCELLMRRFPWPGNLRQLRAACGEIAINLTYPREVLVEDLPYWMTAEPRHLAGHGTASVLREQVLAALKAAGGNKSKAARYLNMTRPKFLRLVERLGLAAPGGEEARSA
jgi:DNA-binding NtrC family response regulator